MAILKTEAVVLKKYKLRETSYILSLYTRDFGKIKVVAKGARTPKSQFKGCMEPMTHLGIVYYEKKTRDLQLLSQASLIHANMHFIGDLKRTTLGFAAAELVDRAVEQEEPHPALFDLLVNVLGHLDRCDGFIEALLWCFESRFIDIMGYRPTWHACLNCNASLGMEGGFFNAENGGLLCQKCGSRAGGLIITGETLEILYFLQSATIDEVPGLYPTPGQKSEIRKMFDLYFKTHIEHMRSLRSLKLYYQMEDE